ncbi:hypothetical protein JRT4AKPX_JRT4AKP_05468 [Klebsiella pneumoniae]|nr:hypothetical protein JRT4AKPX_JRT4AKP_05468 [Klebsiella pneumoniae]
MRNVVHRQLHHERRGFAAHNGVLQHQAGEDGHHNAQHIEREDRQRTVLTKEGGREDGEDRQPRAAGHKRRHHNGHQTLARRVKGAGAHHRRHVAAETDNQRDEGFPRQAEGLHQAIHHKGGARHVAGGLKGGEKQIHHADLRHQRQHGVDTAADPLGEEHGQPVREVQGVTQPLNAMHKDRDRAGIENRLQRAADVDRQQEHQVHDKEKNRQPEEAVEDHFVHRGGEAAWFGGQGIADGVANGGDGLIARVSDVQRRVVDLVAEIRQGDIQFIGGVAGIGPAVNIALQHLQTQPAPLPGRDLR